MGNLAHFSCQKIIDNLIAYIKQHTEKSTMPFLTVFAQRYFSLCSTEDLEDWTIQSLYEMVASHWQLIDRRQLGETKIRVFNMDSIPQNVNQQKGRLIHTVIQLVHDDMPFLVDSVRMVMNKQGYQAHFMTYFGNFRVARNAEDCVIKILPIHLHNTDSKVHKEGVTTEAVIYIEMDCLAEESALQQLKNEILIALADVRVAVADWKSMLARITDCLQELDNPLPELDYAELSESRDFLHWLIQGNFIFLGTRDYKLIGDGINRILQLIPGSGLGVLRDESTSNVSKSYIDLPPQARKMALSKNILIIAKTNTQATVHRLAYTDYIGVKRFNEQGDLIGERRFIGLYTSAAYHSSPRQIPFLRHKVEKVISDLQFPADSHSGKEAVHILETLPRDDLFQATHEELYEWTFSIIQLKERKRIRLLIRRDAFYRYFSCLIYVPLENFNTNLVLSMQTILMDHFQGTECTFTTYFSDSILARIHFLIRVYPKNVIQYDVVSLERKLISAARSWVDKFKQHLIEQEGEVVGLKYYQKYDQAFPASYREYYTPHEAIGDIKRIETLSEDSPLSILFYQQDSILIHLKLFHIEQAVVLSDVLPILENMGLKVIAERPYEIKFKQGACIWVHDFDMMPAIGERIELDAIKHNFQVSFTKIWFNEVENDGLNRLVLEANLTWQETAMLRAYTKYMRQIGIAFSQNYIEKALSNNIEITKLLVQLFILRFDPGVQQYKQSGKKIKPLQLLNQQQVGSQQAMEVYKILWMNKGENKGITEKEAIVKNRVLGIEAGLEVVTSLDEDRILRQILGLILATTRTNYFQKENNQPKSYISIKFNPLMISDLPLPCPQFEIFVYSPFVEGVHLRAEPVARGGIRWSDRQEDFRTEVLNLMKAQQVKNTVIVPGGAKGGFVMKQSPAQELGRDEFLKEGIACYSTFINGLLDVTDNIKKGCIVPPEEVVCYDDYDTYLAVAADKGTATFSNIANELAQKRERWEGDGFASGGLYGYDHKKIGITSKGVWVSVKRHFNEMGIDIEQDDFTVFGIGDMSGDVFGNGMLYSKHIKLVAAFNHLHIFIDPTPDSLKSYKERRRLFHLPRSTWMDYNLEMISPGGGVWSRFAKSIRLTHEIQTLLKTHEQQMTPNVLIRVLFTMPVDLLWSGGIGTFIKSTQETHADVGDRSNDLIRINADKTGARVIAEGGNLGLTQLARIEYSLQGGIVNTDFIDNSAGVNCSDHEVNIKILLGQLVADHQMTQTERNQLLEEMTEEVTELVLIDNYEQTQMLSLEAFVSKNTMDLFRYYIDDLEKTGRLVRELEFLPDEKSFLERKAINKPLTRPEIAMLMAYCKIYLKRDILTSDIPDDPYFERYLLLAFPKQLGEKYFAQMQQHCLRREIIATQLCKKITDRMGINFVERLYRETGASIAFIIRAFEIVSSVFSAETIWKQVTDLDRQVKPIVQYKMMLDIYYLTRRATRWFLRNRSPEVNIQEQIDSFTPKILELLEYQMTLLDRAEQDSLEQELQQLIMDGVPSQLAHLIVERRVLFTALDIIEAATTYQLALADVTKTYYLLGHRLELSWLRHLLHTHLVVSNKWDELARATFRDDLDQVQCKLSICIFLYNRNSQQPIEQIIDDWIKQHSFLIDRWPTLLTEIRANDAINYLAYSLVLKELSDFSYSLMDQVSSCIQ